MHFKELQRQIINKRNRKSNGIPAKTQTTNQQQTESFSSTPVTFFPRSSVQTDTVP